MLQKKAFNAKVTAGVGFALLASLLPGMTAPASAFTDWSTPATVISAGAKSKYPQMAMSDDGTRAVAVWVDETPSPDAVVVASSARISGSTVTWTAPTTISPTGSGDAGVDLDVAISGDGSTAVAVWYAEGTTDRIMSSVAMLGDATDTWQAVSIETVTTSSTPQVDLSNDGSTVVAVWAEKVSGSKVIKSSFGRIADGAVTWAASDVLSAATASVSHVALSKQGSTAAVVWRRDVNNKNTPEARIATFNGATASWGSTSVLDSSADVNNQDVEISDDGATVATIWNLPNAQTPLAQVVTGSVSGNSATWSSPTTVNNSNDAATSTQLSLSADGKAAVAVWSRSLSGAGTPAIQANVAVVSGTQSTWSGVSTLSDSNATGTCTYPESAITADGSSASAIWSCGNSSARMVETISADIDISSGAPSVSWDASKTALSSAGSPDSHRIAMSRNGSNALAVWAMNANSQEVIESASAGVAPTPTPTPTPTPSPSPGQSIGPIVPGTNPHLPADGLPLGKAVLLVNGELTPVTVQPNAKKNPTGVDVESSGFEMFLSGQTTNGTPLGLTPEGALIVEQDRTAFTEGTGFKPNSEVEIYLFSETRTLGKLKTDAQGNYSGSVPLPLDIPAGRHTLQSNGFAPSGDVRSLSLGVQLNAEGENEQRLPTGVGLPSKKKLQASLKKSGSFVVLKKKATTNAGQRVRVAVSCPAVKSLTPSGDVRACWVKRTKSGKVTLYVRDARSVKVTLRMFAPATEDFNRLNVSKGYSVSLR